MRIFIGTFLQGLDCERISRFQQHNSLLAGVKWVKPKKLHMTWSFLGEIEDSRTAALVDAVGKAVASYPPDSEKSEDRAIPSLAQTSQTSLTLQTSQTSLPLRSPESTSLIKSPPAVTFEFSKFWPDEQKPRHFVLEPSATSSRFMALAKLLSTRTAEFQQPTDNLPFRPHVTIARISAQSSPAFERLQSIVPLELLIDQVSVINSHSVKEGEDGYQVLRSFAVGSQA